MRNFKSWLAVAVLFALMPLAHSQTFTVTPASGPGQRTVTWDIPNGNSCQGGGDWAGFKAPNGTEKLTLGAGAHSLTLTCSVPGAVDKADLILKWVPATENTDGTPYTNAKGYQIFYGKTATTMTQQVNIPDPTKTTHAIADVGAGTWFAAIKSWNMADITSDLSGTASKTLSDTQAQQPIVLTANTTVTLAPPKAPVLSIQ